MANPLFSKFGGGGIPQLQGPFGNFMNMLSQFNQFESQFQGDPKAQVQELLNSGKMTQEQFNWLSNTASQFQNMLKYFKMGPKYF